MPRTGRNGRCTTNVGAGFGAPRKSLNDVRTGRESVGMVSTRGEKTTRRKEWPLSRVSEALENLWQGVVLE